MTHQSGAPVTRAAPVKEQLPDAAGEAAQIFRRRGGNTSPLYPPCVFVLACGAVAAGKFPLFDDAKVAKPPARRRRRRQKRLATIGVGFIKNSKKIVWFH